MVHVNTVRLSKTIVRRKYSEVIKDYGTTLQQRSYQNYGTTFLDNTWWFYCTLRFKLTYWTIYKTGNINQFKKRLAETDRNTNEVLLIIKQYYVYGELWYSQETEPVKKLLTCLFWMYFCVIYAYVSFGLWVVCRCLEHEVPSHWPYSVNTLHHSWYLHVLYS